MSIELNWPEIAKRLKALREARLLSQQQVAEKLGLSRRSSLNNIEAGRQKLDAGQLVKLAELYEVSTDYILFGDEIEAQPWAEAVRFVFHTQLEGPGDRRLLREMEEILLAGNEMTREDLRRAFELIRRAQGSPRRRAGRGG